MSEPPSRRLATASQAIVVGCGSPTNVPAWCLLAKLLTLAVGAGTLWAFGWLGWLVRLHGLELGLALFALVAVNWGHLTPLLTTITDLGGKGKLKLTEKVVLVGGL